MLKKSISAILAFIFVTIGGFIIPFINSRPSKFPVESNSTVIDKGDSLIQQVSGVDINQINSLKNDPNGIVIQGYALDPQYYRSGFYNSGSISFEMMVLGKDHVYVSYMQNVYSPNQPFSDGSEVLIYGCKLGQDNLWGANRVIVRSFAIVQLDKEKKLYVDPKASWNCANK